MPSNNTRIAKNQKAQSVHREDGFISILLIFFVGDLYVILIPFCTSFTYNDYHYSAGFGQLKQVRIVFM